MFKLGKVVQTAGVAEAILTSKEFSKFVAHSLRRYTQCDWGEVDKEDCEANDDAVKNGDRILASYISSDGVKIWIITECDRSYTTILFPDEY